MTDRSPLRRRSFLTYSAVLLGSSAVPAYAFAQVAAPVAANATPPVAANDAAPAPPAAPAGTQFSFDILSDQMKQKAKTDFASAEIKLPDFIAQLGYDDYQHIQYRPDHARWSDPGILFRIHAFHMGWLFKEPVHLFEIDNGLATPMNFTTGEDRKSVV